MATLNDKFQAIYDRIGNIEHKMAMAEDMCVDRGIHEDFDSWLKAREVRNDFKSSAGGARVYASILRQWDEIRERYGVK